MRRFFLFALSHDDGARGKGGRHGGRDNHPKTKIVGVNHGAFRNALVLLGTATTTAATTAVAIIAVTVAACFAGRGRTRRVVTTTVAVGVAGAFAGMRDSLSVSTRVSQDALGAAAIIVARTRADCT
jgi:hypothetical protein